MTATELEIKSIGIIGGTGKEGKGLAYRWAKAGFKVLIGSRSIEKANAAVIDLKNILPKECMVEGYINADVVRAADIAVLTVPYVAHIETLSGLSDVLQGKILIDVTVPLVPPRVTRAQMPPEGSAAQQAQSILGEGVRVVAAFQNISYEKLITDEPINCHVLVCGNGKSARMEVLKLVHSAGLVGWDAGPIENAMVVEGLTSILIGINKQFNIESAGIQITGVGL